MLAYFRTLVRKHPVLQAELPHLQNFNTAKILYFTVQGEKKTVNLLYEALKNCKVLYKTKGKQENSLTYSINHQFTLNKPFCSYSFVLHLT